MWCYGKDVDYIYCTSGLDARKRKRPRETSRKTCSSAPFSPQARPYAVGDVHYLEGQVAAEPHLVRRRHQPEGLSAGR